MSASTLAFSGVLLFFLGLVTGFAIPRMRSARLGLSAHLVATQSGVALIAFAFLWPHLRFWAGWAAPLAHALWISLYVTWIGYVLAAAWGTGRSLPIAGAGTSAEPWQERMAFVPIAIGAFATFAVIALVLVQWNWVA
jgi:hydroxylaminobenzene mutase